MLVEVEEVGNKVEDDVDVVEVLVEVEDELLVLELSTTTAWLICKQLPVISHIVRETILEALNHGRHTLLILTVRYCEPRGFISVCHLFDSQYHQVTFEYHNEGSTHQLASIELITTAT